MNQRSVAETYRVASFENAPPIKIIRMLYQGALRYLVQALEAGEHERAAFSDSVMRADRIVVELRLALEPEANTELCEKLESLYLFVEECLSRSIRDSDPRPLEDARIVLSTLLDGWNKVELAAAEAA